MMKWVLGVLPRDIRGYPCWKILWWLKAVGNMGACFLLPTTFFPPSLLYITLFISLYISCWGTRYVRPLILSLSSHRGQTPPPPTIFIFVHFSISKSWGKSEVIESYFFLLFTPFNPTSDLPYICPICLV